MNEAYVFALDSGKAIQEYLLDWVHEIQRLLQTGQHLAFRVFVNVFVVAAAIFSATLFVLVVLFGCLNVAFASSVALRHYFLLRTPGNQLLPLDFNTMPFETELWRLQNLDGAVTQASPLLEAPPRRSDKVLTVLDEGGAGTHLAASLIEQASSLKMSLISRYVQNTVATSTLIIPSLVEREVFPPGGGVSMEALFQRGKPMFNAKGVYDAKVQLVFLREEVGRDVSMVLQSSVLISEDSSVPQVVSSLDVLFKTTTSFSFVTGEKARSWLLQLLTTTFSLVFCVPLWLYEKIVPSLQNDVFPSIDSLREVAVVATVYTDFEPPVALQPRLRAINFTLYQQQVGDALGKVRLTRVYFYTTVQLTGLAYYFSKYPFGSFVATTLLLFAIFTAAVVGVSLAAGGVVFSLHVRAKRGPEDAIGADDIDDNDDADFSDPTRPDVRFRTPMSMSLRDAEYLVGGFERTPSSSSFSLHELLPPHIRRKKSD
ncbi:hypothetical protein DQ04_00961050 [Trypanosoma grayi]|uniref:hypothetical protein n=1 Tax=Trypanosoma grayi TaxID=71804 RepID=UPI0004F4608C|nr:hypothetical protein DQ04_00961050 [Trypanosoma grayi]KEG13512.1 hypothetical protein DQ04_00961050 [Trypanosoma grayi]